MLDYSISENFFLQEIFTAVMRGDLDRVKALIEDHPEWINN